MDLFQMLLLAKLKNLISELWLTSKYCVSKLKHNSMQFFYHVTFSDSVKEDKQ